LAARQAELDVGLDVAARAASGSGPLEIVYSRMGHLWEALCAAYDTFGLTEAASGDEVFRHLVLARIIEPTSKQDSLRVLGEVGVKAVWFFTLNRRLPVYATQKWRHKLARPARNMRRWARPFWSCSTCPPSISILRLMEH
jgi:hypothetical protein